MTRAVPGTPALQDRIEGGIPPFEPPAWLRSNHAQTVAGRYLVNGDSRLDSTAYEVALDDGDRLCVLETVPRIWRPADPAAVLVHGLAGCACSPYVVRFAQRLVRLGLRVVRMNLRGAGAGFGLARGIYHAGRSDDLRTVIEWLAERAPGSPVALAGFSLVRQSRTQAGRGGCRSARGRARLRARRESADRPLGLLRRDEAARKPAL